MAAGGVNFGFPLFTSFALQTAPRRPAPGLCRPAAIGYAEGALLSREIGSWQTICWALVLAMPVTVATTITITLTPGWPQADAPAWLAFAYMALFSMFLGFFAWYRGLTIACAAAAVRSRVRPAASVAESRPAPRRQAPR